MPRIAVTGMGVVSPIGNGVANFWAALCRGADGIGPLTRCDPAPFDIKHAGEIKDFQAPAELLRQYPGIDPANQFLWVAAREAVAASGLATLSEGRDRIGVAVATNFGGLSAGEELIAHLAGRGPAPDQALSRMAFQPAADLLADWWRWGGPRIALSLSCASGTAALAYAWELIQAGRANVVVAGGYDALSRCAWSGLSCLRTMTKDKIRPFDKNRAGTIFGEGAGVLVLEEWEHARRRGATIQAEALGVGLNNNAFHMTAPDKEGAGLRQAMATALQQAGIEPEQVDHINTHGTGTKYNDVTETQAIKALFGKHAYRIPLTAIKAMTGHTMGAAGSMEAIATILAIRDGLVPPTINYQTPDPECDLNYTTNQAASCRIDTALSNSAGIGGCNAAIVFRRM